MKRARIREKKRRLWFIWYLEDDQFCKCGGTCGVAGSHGEVFMGGEGAQG
jgi:hypothetical protein